MRICYHGTDEKAAEAIREEGFHADSWFALELANALEFGGPYVFEVMFEDPPGGWEGFDWQFHYYDKVAPEKIVALRYYTIETVEDYPDRRQQVFDSNTGGDDGRAS